ncbi:MAG: tetratricopeptide repeat protein, partial [Candidatus Binatia bacterium]
MRMLLVALLSALLSANTLDAANPPERAASLRRFFSWSSWAPQELRLALEDYENGRLFDAAAAADRGLRSPEAQGFRDDLLLVRGLALAELGWRKEAAESFSGILEASVPSPYYPLALLGLVESHHRGGRYEAVAAAYRRYFERPWRGGSRRDKLIRN